MCGGKEGCAMKGKVVGWKGQCGVEGRVVRGMEGWGCDMLSIPRSV